MKKRDKYFDILDLRASLSWFNGNAVRRFEQSFSAYVGVAHAIGTSYGRTALYLGLKAIGVQGYDVLLPAFTCTVVRQAVVLAGATPVFVDVDFNTLDMDLDDLKKKRSPRAKALLITHYFGRVAGNLSQVIQYARESGLVSIEDCAHSLGAEYRGKKVGAFADISIFSLTKSMINYGGGVLATNDEHLHRKARALLAQNRKDAITGLVEHMLILSYGLNQMIHKLIFDRIATRKPRWILAFPRVIENMSHALLAIIDIPRRFSGRLQVRNVYGQCITMAPVVASLGYSQLRKIDVLIGRRRCIRARFAQEPWSHFRVIQENAEHREVCTYAVLRFDNISSVVDRGRKAGLPLVSTWPTRQKLWRHLDSANMKRIEQQLLTLCVNPELNDHEIEVFRQFMNGICELNDIRSDSLPSILRANEQ